MNYLVFKITSCLELTKFNFLLVFKEFKAREYKVISVKWIYLFLRRNLIVSGFSLFILNVGNLFSLIIIFIMLIANRMLLEFGHTIRLLGNLLWNSLNFLSKLTYSLFSSIPLIFNSFISLLLNSGDDIMFQIINSLPERGKVGLNLFSVRRKHPNELLKFYWHTATQCFNNVALDIT